MDFTNRRSLCSALRKLRDTRRFPIFALLKLALGSSIIFKADSKFDTARSNSGGVSVFAFSERLRAILTKALAAFVFTPGLESLSRETSCGSTVLASGPRLSKTSARSEERFSRNAENDIVCRLLFEKKEERYPHITLSQQRSENVSEDSTSTSVR